MGERPKIAPPAVQSSGVVDKTADPDDQSSLQASSPGLSFAEFWPPAGWPMFACVTRPSGTVMSTEMGVYGDQALLKYDVRIDANGVYTIEILKGALKANGGISLSPALGIRFSGREDWYEDDRPEKDVLDILINGQSVKPEHSLILRTILATTFLISRIDRGLVPNLKKTMKIYRLES